MIACITPSTTSATVYLLYNLKLVVNIGGILLVAHVASLLHVCRHTCVVLFDATFVVTAKSVAAEVRVCCIEVCFCFLCCFCVGLWKLLVDFSMVCNGTTFVGI
jgi:hypothetical protein